MEHLCVQIQLSPDSLPSIPSWFGEVAVFAHCLTHEGIPKAIQEQVRFARACMGTYELIDFVAVVIGYVLDHRIKTDMRIRMQEKTHESRQDIHRRMKQAPGEEARQLVVLEAYAATVEGALNLESLAPFGYGGLAVQEALTQIHSSLNGLKKGGRAQSNV